MQTKSRNPLHQETRLRTQFPLRRIKKKTSSTIKGTTLTRIRRDSIAIHEDITKGLQE